MKTQLLHILSSLYIQVIFAFFVVAVMLFGVVSVSEGYGQSYYQGGYYNQGSYQSYYQSTYTTLTGNVQFAGNLSITGALSKGSGSFVIDHPLDPKNKLLYHSFVESPDVKNIYDGVATLDETGSVTITLPDYFQALNRDFRYQFFPFDEAMPGLHIASEVRDNTFIIAGGTPGGEISWQVTGIRHDPYIRANPIIPEVQKGPTELVDVGECIFEPLCR